MKRKQPSTELTTEQETALHHALLGQHVFITGPAGTGKSFLLQTMIKSLKTTKVVAITATTGIAAVNIGGTTLFNMFSMHPKMVDSGDVRSCKRWIDLDVLIIDEISMCDPALFLALDKQARVSRHVEKPFGGVQLIMIGDFFQLPPIVKQPLSDKPLFIFQLPVYQAMMNGETGVNVELQTIFRQSEHEFATLLNHMRIGQLSATELTIIKKIMDRPITEASDGTGIQYTKLFGRKQNVATVNQQEVRKIQSARVVYDMEIQYGVGCEQFGTREKEKYKQQVMKNISNDVSVELCVGAQVMLTANLDVRIGLANGARGVVLEFLDGYPIVQFVDTKVRVCLHKLEVELYPGATVTIQAMPLKLAYAITIHKSQGQSINFLELHMGQCWEYGQCYTAFSRATSMETLRIKEFTPQSVKAHPIVKEFYAQMSVCC